LDGLPTSSNLLSRRFDDFDRLCEAILAWDLDLRQLDCGPFSGLLLQSVGGPTQLLYARFSRHVEQRGSPPAKSWTFGVPTPGCPPFYVCGRVVGAGMLVALPPGSELVSVSPGGFSVLAISVAEDHLARVAQRRGMVGFLERLGDREVLTAPCQGLREVLGLAAQLFEMQRVPPSTVDTASHARRLEFETVAALLSCLDGAGKGPRGRPRDAIVAPAIAHAWARGREPLTVAALSSAVGVSERTLRRAFTERLGVSPKAYLIAHRLNGVRKDLRSASLGGGSVTVSKVAHRWGFRHRGQLAEAYRAAFGELPSETRRA